MSKISRRNFMKGAAVGTVGVAAAGLLTACGNNNTTASAGSSSTAGTDKTPAIPSSPVDGKYVTSAVGHEGLIHVCTTMRDGAIAACEVLSHEETIGIGNYACSRIPAAIVKYQSINVPNLRGSSFTSMAIKSAVKDAIIQSGYNVDDFSAKITPETSNEVIEDTADVIIVGAGTSGLVAAARLLEAGKSVILVEKRDIPGGSMSMTYGGVATAGSKLQTNFDVDGSYRASAMGTLDSMMNFWKSMKQYHRTEFFNGEMPFMTQQYTHAGDMLDWLHGMGVGFNCLGNYEGGTQYGAATPYLAPGCYEGGAGYAMMFLVNRIGMYKDADGNPMGKIIYSTSATDLIKDEKGKYIGCHAESTNGAKYTLTGKAVCLASGGFARNKEMLQKYCPDYADFFFNCASSMEGDGIRMGLEAGGVVECENRPLPAFLSSYKSKFELAFCTWHHGQHQW